MTSSSARQTQTRKGFKYMGKDDTLDDSRVTVVVRTNGSVKVDERKEVEQAVTLAQWTAYNGARVLLLKMGEHVTLEALRDILSKIESEHPAIQFPPR